MYPVSYLAELFSNQKFYFSETITKIRNEFYSKNFLRYLPNEILSLMLPYPTSTVPIKQFSFTDCCTIWVSLVISLIYFLHNMFQSNSNWLYSLVYICSSIGIFPSSTRIGVRHIFVSFKTLYLCLSLPTVIDHH